MDLILHTFRLSRSTTTEAELHTDSSFKQAPEQCVFLFVVRPAADGGGITKLLSADHLLTKFSDDTGRESIKLLSSIAWPFRVPTVFTKRRSEDDVEWICAPILSDKPRIRFRYDLIASGLKYISSGPLPDRERALSHFRRVLNESACVSVPLARGDLLVLNNHVILHGRSPFDDFERLLLRVRLSTTH